MVLAGIISIAVLIEIFKLTKGKSKLKGISDIPNFDIQIVKNILDKTKKQYIAIQAVKSSHELPPTSSKFGGMPYIPFKSKWPVDANNKDLFFLAQINFKELPQTSLLPVKGILQFFISNDDVFSEYKVIYYENLTDYYRYFSDLGYQPKLEDYYKPFKQEFALKFTIQESYISEMDKGFDKLFSDNDIDKLSEADMNGIIKKKLGFPLGNDSEAKHQLLGYPSFTQFDPRENDDFILLFQIDSQFNNVTKDWDIIFGDSGIMNFFISQKDLENKNFSKVFYTWDCA